MSAKTTVVLDGPPSMTGLYARALAGVARSTVGRLPGLGRGKQGLPETVLVLGDVEVRRERVIAYSRVCGFRLRDECPATYPHMLTFPLQMTLMAGSDFPFPAVGLVHIANRIDQHRALRAQERLELRVWADDLRPHERGTQVDLRAEVRVGDTLNGAGELAWESTSTYLHRGGSPGASGDAAASGPDGRRNGKGKRSAVPAPSRTPVTIWDIPGDIGRRYGDVSGDRNPIHLHPLSAKLFGMPRAIAHGMWLKARCLAALEAHLPEALSAEVRFKLPVLLPARVSFSAWPEGSVEHFAVRDRRGEKPHLDGTVRPLAA
jgi:acyl dehydratase